MRIGLVVAACAIATSWAAPAAQAAVTYTFSGTVGASSFDDLGLFAPADLQAGTPFSVVETYDFSKAQFSTDSYGSGNDYYYFGGSQYNAPAFGSATLHVGGSSLSVSGDALTSVTSTYGPTTTFTLRSTPLAGVSFQTSLPDIMAAGTYALNGDYGLDRFLDYTDITKRTVVNLDTATVVVAPDASVGTVPLPASAPMFGAALVATGVIGVGLKRRKAA